MQLCEFVCEGEARSGCGFGEGEIYEGCHKKELPRGRREAAVAVGVWADGRDDSGEG